MHRAGIEIAAIQHARRPSSGDQSRRKSLAHNACFSQCTPCAKLVSSPMLPRTCNRKLSTAASASASRSSALPTGTQMTNGNKHAASAWLTTRSSRWRRIHVLHDRRNMGSRQSDWNIFWNVNGRIERCRDSRITQYRWQTNGRREHGINSFNRYLHAVTKLQIKFAPQGVGFAETRSDCSVQDTGEQLQDSADGLAESFPLGHRKNVPDTLGLKSCNIRENISFGIVFSFFTS